MPNHGRRCGFGRQCPSTNTPIHCQEVSGTKSTNCLRVRCPASIFSVSSREGVFADLIIAHLFMASKSGPGLASGISSICFQIVVDGGRFYAKPDVFSSLSAASFNALHSCYRRHGSKAEPPSQRSVTSFCPSLGTQIWSHGSNSTESSRTFGWSEFLQEHLGQPNR